MAWAFAVLLAGIVLLGCGAGGWLRQARRGLAVTSLNDFVPWGLYISSFFFLSAIGAGALLLASLAYLVPGLAMAAGLARLAASLALGCFIGAGSLVVSDIGRPANLLRTLANWRLASPFTWDALFLFLGLVLSGFLTFGPVKPWLAPWSLGLAAAVFLTHGYIFWGSRPHPWWHNGYLVVRFATEGALGATAAVHILALATARTAWPLAGSLFLPLLAAVLVFLLVERAQEAFQRQAASRFQPASFLPLEVASSLDQPEGLSPWQLCLFFGLPGALALLARTSDGAAWPLAAGGSLVLIGLYLEKQALLLAPQLRPFIRYPRTFKNPGPTYRPTRVEYCVAAGAFGLVLVVAALGAITVLGG